MELSSYGTIDEFTQYRFHIWELFFAPMTADMFFLMRLMGIGNLCELTKCTDAGIASAAAALWTELAAGSWKSEPEFAEHYPLATIDGAEARIPLGGSYHVDLMINYQAEIVLINYAGVANNAQSRRATKGKAA
ncbi:hypothetical protein GFL72_19610 [Rhizobium leguminosarum bv. viciae]|uniref:hypothetical protein n=1 Tax=Rhizobium leguminosarum TaxID=384 RepID=UPI001441C08B|nr:hypothetical protein [Rhizobium leguminosarum]NKK36828.1 hypothetical protein [Rhizobium leguminosarum bv. viciae]